MSFNFDFKIPNLPDFSKIDLTGLPSNLNLGTLGTSGASIMDSPPVNMAPPLTREVVKDSCHNRLIHRHSLQPKFLGII